MTVDELREAAMLLERTIQLRKLNYKLTHADRYAKIQLQGVASNNEVLDLWSITMPELQELVVLSESNCVARLRALGTTM